MNNKLKKEFVYELNKKISAVDKIPKDIIREINKAGNKFSGSTTMQCPSIDEAFGKKMILKILSLDYDYVEYISMGQFIEEIMGDSVATTIEADGMELKQIYVPICFIRNKKQKYIYA